MVGRRSLAPLTNTIISKTLMTYKHKPNYMYGKNKSRMKKYIHKSQKKGFWDTVKGIGSGIVKGLGTIGHIGHQVTEVIDEVGLGDFARSVVPGYGLIDKGLDVVDNLYEKGNRALEFGEQMYDNSQWLSNRLGIGAEDYRSDLSFNDRIVRGLQVANNYSEEDARSMMLNYRNKAMNSLRDTGVRLYNDHVGHLTSLQNDAKAYLLQNPLFEGGMHTYPTTGQTLVQGLSSALDGYAGARGIYEPNLPYNMFDKFSSGVQSYGQSMMASLRQATYGSSTPSDLYSTWNQPLVGVADRYGSASSALLQPFGY